MKTLSITHLVAMAALCGVACSGDDNNGGAGTNCDGGKCDDDDEIPASPCDGIVHDRAGRGLGSGRIAGSLGDPVAQIAFAGDSCPTTFSDVVAKLNASGKCENHKTVMVSEDSQLLEEPGSYRAVTSLDCETEGGTTGVVWFSAFGIRATSPLEETRIPESVEMMAFDPVEGVFNYYETEGDNIAFFGDSKQMITQGTGSGGDRRCAACHTGGGLIMKELAAPWVHWPLDFDTPGHSQIIDGNSELLGAESDGAEIESQVDQGNSDWNESRLAFLRTGAGTTNALADLLRPAFCTVEVNLDSNFGTTVSGGPLSGAVVDSALSDFSDVGMSNDEYQLIIEENGQRMAAGGNDTVGALTRIARARADIEFTRLLVNEGVLDNEFVSDVRLVDFTRSIFSEDRCELLGFVPDLSGDDITAEKIRAGFIENLEAESPAEGTPAGDFLRNLQDDQDNASGTIAKFESACTDREDKVTVGGEEVNAAAVDYMTYISHARGIAADLPVFEFDGATMPLDAVNVAAGTRLHPETCELTTNYVSVTPEVGEDGDSSGSSGSSGGGEGDQSGSCEDRCDEDFNEGNSCQCDEECDENEDCCDDKAELCGGGEDTGTPATDSCEGRCGLFNPDADCQCNDLCDDAGDCCEDFAAECAEAPPGK